MNKILHRLFPTLMLGACSLASAQTVLSVSSWVPPSHHINTNLKTWCAEVEQGTAGRVKCDMLAKPVAPPHLALNSVRNGLADLSFTVAAYSSEPLPVSMMFSVPFLAGPKASGQSFSVAYQRIFDRHLVRYDEFKGVKVLTAATGSPQQMYFTVAKPVRTLSDLKGLKIQVGSKGAADMVVALGAQPVVKPASQLYEMFSGGIVDGSFNPIETVKSFKVNTFVKNVTLVPGGINYGVFMFYMSEDKWKKISKEDQGVIERASGERFARRHGAGFDAEDRDATALLQASGATIIPAPEAMLREMVVAAEPIAKDLIAAARARGVADSERILSELKAEIEKAAAEQASPRAAPL